MFQSTAAAVISKTTKDCWFNQFTVWMTDFHKPDFTNLISIGVLAWRSGVSCKYRLKSMKPICQQQTHVLQLPTDTTNPHCYVTTPLCSTGFIWSCYELGQVCRTMNIQWYPADKWRIKLHYFSYNTLSFNFYINLIDHFSLKFIKMK